MTARFSGKATEIMGFPNALPDSRDDEIAALKAQLAHETTLRKRYETRFRQLSASLPVVIWMADDRLRVTFISDNWYDLTGTGPDETESWLETIHREDRERTAAALRAASERRERYAVEYRVLKADGTLAWVLNMGAPKFDEAGRYDGYVGAVVDVSERRAATEALQVLEARLSLALDGTRVGVWDWDIAAGTVWFSGSALAIQGFDGGESSELAEAAGAFVHPEDTGGLKRALSACLKGEHPMIDLEQRVRRRDGSWVWVSERGRVVERDANGRALRMIGTRTDMTEQRQRDERLRWLAAHDVLTELPNRGRFQELLLAAMRETDARGGKMALMLVDLDRFKKVNDSFGHDAGDALLRRTAKQLREDFTGSFVARLGGDEFAIIVPDAGAGVDALMALAGRAVRAGMDAGEAARESTASIGVALFPDHAQNAADLIKAADVALYRAKDAGRARAELYVPRL